MNQSFENTIKDLTKPLNDQYPRPWTTKLKDPCKADSFLISVMWFSESR